MRLAGMRLGPNQSTPHKTVNTKPNLRDKTARIGRAPDSLTRLVFCVLGADARLAALRALASYAVVLADVHARSELYRGVLQGRETNGILRHLCRRICLHQQTYDLHVAVSKGEMQWRLVLLVSSVGACFAFEQELDDSRLARTASVMERRPLCNFVVCRIDLQAVGEEERNHTYLPVPGSAFCVSMCTFVPVK